MCYTSYCCHNARNRASLYSNSSEHAEPVCKGPSVSILSFAGFAAHKHLTGHLIVGKESFRMDAKGIGDRGPDEHCAFCLRKTREIDGTNRFLCLDEASRGGKSVLQGH